MGVAQAHHCQRFHQYRNQRGSRSNAPQELQAVVPTVLQQRAGTPKHDAARFFRIEQRDDARKCAQIKRRHQTGQHHQERHQIPPGRQPQHHRQRQRRAAECYRRIAPSQQGRREYRSGHQSRLRAAAHGQSAVGSEWIAHDLLQQHGGQSQCAARKQSHGHARQGIVLHYQRINGQRIGRGKPIGRRPMPLQF